MSADIRIGTCAWSYDDWRGTFYPENLPANQWLEFYSRCFAAVEIDSTFYGVPKAHVLGHWLDETPESFSFTCKISREITHERQLRDCGKQVDEFLRGIAPLHSRLGCVLVQLPSSFTPSRHESDLRAFVADLPRDFRFAFEFRNRDWHHPRIVRLLEERGICWVWNDLTSVEEQNRAAFEFLPQTTDFLYLRLMGDSATKYKSDGSRAHRYGTLLWPRTSSLESWAIKIEKHAAEAAPVFVFLSNHFEGFSPLSAQRLASRLGIDIRLPDSGSHDSGDQLQLEIT